MYCKSVRKRRQQEKKHTIKFGVPERWFQLFDNNFYKFLPSLINCFFCESTHQKTYNVIFHSVYGNTRNNFQQNNNDVLTCIVFSLLYIYSIHSSTLMNGFLSSGDVTIRQNYKLNSKRVGMVEDDQQVTQDCGIFEEFYYQLKVLLTCNVTNVKHVNKMREILTFKMLLSYSIQCFLSYQIINVFMLLKHLVCKTHVKDAFESIKNTKTS